MHRSLGENELQCATSEGMFACHCIKQGLSFRASDQTSKLNWRMFDRKCYYLRIKSEATAADHMLIIKSLSTVNVVASNRKQVKLIPIYQFWFHVFIPRTV
jgi:hypothetical protein